MTKRRLLSAAFLAAAAACSKPATVAPGPAAPTAVTPVAATGDDKQPPAPPAAHERFAQTCKDEIASARTLMASVAASKEPTVEGTLVPYNDMLILIAGAAARAELFAEVHPDEAMRTAGEDCTKEVLKLDSERLLNRELWAAIKAVDLAGADPDTKHFVERTLRDFRLAGVDKDPETRAKIQQIKDELVAIGLVFDKNIREDVRRVKMDPSELEGLPADYIKAHPPGPDGKVEISTDNPDYLPFRSYAKSGDARKRLVTEYLNRGYPQNDEVLRKMLVTRRYLATLLGHKSYADLITEDKMIESAKNAAEFIDKISKAADRAAKRDVKALLARKRKDEPKATVVHEWEKAYYEELVKKEQLGFDSQSVRPYFDFAPTRDGLLAMTSKLFGVEYRKVDGVEVWHEDVTVHDVYQDGQKLGRIYLDLHPRANKFKHAAQFTRVPGVAGKQLPEGVLVCNFPDPKTGGGVALMDHGDVETMFHEFGHLVHHILGGRQRWVDLSGVATEHDFVEAPSQILEEWAWDPATLQLFARHVETKEPIPVEVVQKMKRASEFGKGAFARTQMFYAAVSLYMHLQDPTTIDFTKLTADLQKKYAMFPYIEGTHFYDSFGHLNGYSAVYYTYMWSLVIAKDLFSEFQKKGMYDAETARRYRDAVLVPGGSKDAADLVKDFLGRPYSFEAYRRWLEQT